MAPGANRTLDVAHVTAALDALARPGDCVVASLEIPLTTAAAALTAARASGARTLLNPAPWRGDATELFAASDVVVPNEGELDAIGGVEAARAAGATAVVVTRGERGVRVLLTGATSDVDAPTIDAIDSTGVGDAFCGALATELAAGAALVDAARFAAAAGALACTGVGARTALATREEIERLLTLPDGGRSAPHRP